MLDFLNHVGSAINSFSGGELAVSLAAILEFVFRVIPTQQPLSILLFGQEVCKALGDTLEAIAGALDHILPQNIAPAAAAAPPAPPAQK